MLTETCIWRKQLLIFFFFIWHKKVNLFIAILKISTAKADFAILPICIFPLMAKGWVIFPNILVHNFLNVDLIILNVVFIP